MKTLVIAVALAAGLAGCAIEPMTPEQQAFMRQWALEQQRASNAQAAQPYYNIVQPTPLQRPSAPAASPLTPTVIATWTGRSELGRSVTGASGFNCEYYYAGKKFWQMHAGACPSSVWVQ